MKREDIYERRQSAARMEVVMLAATAIGLFTTVAMFLTYGLFAGFAMSVTTLIAYGLSRVFDFISVLLACMVPDDPPSKASPEKEA